jgi:DNA polymerase V
VTELSDLNEAVTHFASRAAEKLRKQGSTAHQLMCFVRTSLFRQDAQYSRSICMPLRRPTADTGALVSAAVTELKAIFRPSFNYAKAGVMLMDLQADTVSQGELDLESDDRPDHSKLMTTLDGLNQRFGKGTVLMASAGLV